MASAPGLIINLPGAPYNNLPIYASVAAIRAIPSSTINNGDEAVLPPGGSLVKGAAYQFVAGSTLTDDGFSVLKPNDLTPLQAGRWLSTVAMVAGPPGPSNNTRISLDALKAAPTTDVTSLYGGAVWTWTLGDFTLQADDVSVVQANGVPLTTGAWVRGIAGAIPVSAMLLSGHRSDQAQAMDLFLTYDGKTLRKVNAASLGYNGPGNSQPSVVPALGVRDPSLIYWRGRFYLAYSVGFDYNYVGLAVSDDLVKWYDLGTPQPANSIRPATGSGLSFATASRPNTKLAYAPRWFVHPTTDALYLEVSLSDNIDPSQQTHYMVSRKLLAAVPSGNTADWEDVVSFGYGFNYIDGSTAFEGGRFYHFVKNETTKYIEKFENTVYGSGSGWTKTGADNWSGWGAGLEAPRLAQFNGLWHIFLDPFNGYQYYHATFTALANQPSAKELIDFGPSQSARHLHPLPLSQALHVKAYDAAAMLASRGDGDPAAYVIDGMNREAQVVNSQVLTGTPLASTFMRFRYGNDLTSQDAALFQMRCLNTTNDGIDFIHYRTRGYATLAYIIGNVVYEGLRIYPTGKFEAPNDFMPRPFAPSFVYSNGWADTSSPVSTNKTAVGLIAMVGQCSRSGTPTANEVMFALPAIYWPKFKVTLSLFTLAGTAVQVTIGTDGNVRWQSGATTSVNFDAVSYLAASAIA